MLVINRYEQLNASEKQALVAWIMALNSQVTIIWSVSEQTTSDLHPSDDYLSALRSQLTTSSRTISQQRTINITPPQKPMVSLRPQTNALSIAPLSNDDSLDEGHTQISTESDLPYRYHEQQQALQLAGWRLPASYMLNADDLQNWLLALPNWQRIKGVVHTSDGWLQINFTPDSLTTSTIESQPDSRLEIILQSEDAFDTNTKSADGQYEPELSSTAIDWEVCDRELMAMVV